MVKIKKGENLQESLNNVATAIKDGSKNIGNQPLVPTKKDECVLRIPATGEKVVYSKEVHGKDYREIAEETAKKYDGIVE